MKKALLLLLSTLLFTATAHAGMRTDNLTATESFVMPQLTDCSGVIAEGSQCWDTDDNKLYVGDGAAAVEITAAGAGSPGGDNTEIQYNSSAAFAGDDELTYDATNNILTVGSTTIGGTGERITGATHAEYIDFDDQGDDYILFAGSGGADDTDLVMDLDGTHPVISSNTDKGVGINGLALVPGVIAADDATPDVSNGNVFVTSANTLAVEITDLDNPTVGQLIVIIGGSAADSSTITDGGNFALSAGYTATVDEVLILWVQADNDYIELGRSTN